MNICVVCGETRGGFEDKEAVKKHIYENHMILEIVDFLSEFEQNDMS